MPWNEQNYPPSMKNLKKSGSKKKLLRSQMRLKKKNYDDKRAISIAMEQAEKWYQHRSDLKDDTPFKKNLRRHS